MSSFSEEELAIAKSVDLVAVASSLGYTPKKIGKYYTLKEMDSMRIYDRRNWFRWSQKDVKGHNGGSQIDFLCEFAGLNVKDAVFWLLDFVGYRHEEKCAGSIQLSNIAPMKSENVKREFVLPESAPNNNRIVDYLNRCRGLSVSTIDFFINSGLIYESKDYHNVVFKGNDKWGNTKFASQRGIYDKNGKSFKCDVAGNDKRYGFNVSNDSSDRIVVFEAAIDLMSYMDIFQDYDSNMLALGMVSDAPLETFLQEHPQITQIQFALDNDEPGRTATRNLMEKYEAKGYDVKDTPAPVMFKDINEWLVAARLNLSESMVSERRHNFI